VSRPAAVQDRNDQPIHTGATTMPKPTKLGQADAKKRVAAASDHLRTLGRNAPKWTRTDNPDGTITFTAIDGEHLFTIAGMWTQPLADYLDALHPYTGVGIAELLWQISMGLDPLATAAGVAGQLLRRPRE
jgi:hypothetical protein